MMYKSDNEMFMKALAFATEKHKNQTRKDGTPYIWHPIRVAQLVKDADYDAKKKDGFVKG